MVKGCCATHHNSILAEIIRDFVCPLPDGVETYDEWREASKITKIYPKLFWRKLLGSSSDPNPDGVETYAER